MSKKTILGILVAVSTLVFSAAAHATPTLTLTLSEGIYSPLVLTSNTGYVSYAGTQTTPASFGTFSVNTITGVGDPNIGQPFLPQIDLNSVDVSTTAAGTLSILLVQSGVPTSAGLATVNGSIGGTLGSNQTLTYYVQANGATVASKAFTNSGGSFSADLSGFADFNGINDTISELVVITSSGASSTSFDALEAVPEPAAIVLLGSGLFGLCLIRRRRC